MNGKPDETEAESRRILNRISKDWESGSPSSPLARRVDRARDHLAAADADQSDWVEVWGTRIGRTVGVLFLAVFAIWLALNIFRGG